MHKTWGDSPWFTYSSCPYCRHLCVVEGIVTQATIIIRREILGVIMRLRLIHISVVGTLYLFSGSVQIITSTSLVCYSSVSYFTFCPYQCCLFFYSIWFRPVAVASLVKEVAEVSFLPVAVHRWSGGGMEAKKNYSTSHCCMPDNLLRFVCAQLIIGSPNFHK